MKGKGWLAGMATGICLLPMTALGGELELLSRSAFGDLGNGVSADAVISGDGRFVAFTSDASNLVEGDPGSWYWGTDPDIFLVDRVAGTVANASRALNREGLWYYKTVCRNPALDESGARVAFECFNGYHGANNMSFDIYLFERATDTTSKVSVGLGGLKANGGSRDAVLSADGATLAFASTAFNLLAADVDNLQDIYLYDLGSGTLELASVGAEGRKGNGASSSPALSRDGRLVAFASTASNLVPNDDNGVADIFLRDRSSGTLQRIVAPAGGICAEPTLNADGTLLAFSALAANGTRTLYLARNGAPPQAVAVGSAPALSADGRFLAYVAALPAAPAGTNGVYRRDLDRGRSELLSVTPENAPAFGTAGAPALSNHGAEVVFASTAADLIGNDDNGVADIFLATATSDSTPPLVALRLSQSQLWPPNKKFVAVRIDGSATDESELAQVEITVRDEYGSLVEQIVPGFGSTIWLEAWRDGDDLDGRHYTITAVAIDAAGNRSEACATVLVPHDMSGKPR